MRYIVYISVILAAMFAAKITTRHHPPVGAVPAAVSPVPAHRGPDL